MYTIERIAKIIHAEAAIGSEDAKIVHLITDSRRIAFPQTSLFFALQTARRNGHDFIQDAYEQGVRSFVADKSFAADAFKEANFLVVEDTLKALQTLAAYHRTQFNYPVIGITGSNGKTIVKEWLYQLLHEDYLIIRSPRSYNSQIGVPLSVWQMNENYDLGIFEAGISEKNEMKALAEIIQPTIGVFTNLGDVHKEGFESIEQKAKEKLKLFNKAEVLICNNDPVIAEAIPENHSYKIFKWSSNEDADVRIISIDKGGSSTSINGSYQNKSFTFSIPFTDEASIENAITCLCVLLYLKIDIDVIAERLKKLHAVEMRLQLIPAVNGCSVINDSYSFDINSFNIALDFLLQQHQYSSTTVFISDLPSQDNIESYNDAAAILHAKNIHRVIAIGEKWYAHPDILSPEVFVTEYYKSTADFINHFNANHFKNEAILLKGARVFGFEKIVALLEQKVHQTVMEINLTAMSHNIRQYRMHLKQGTKLMAMVKAFGYGSGSAEIGNLLQFNKVDYLAVAYADEGVELRKAGVHLPILVLNVDEAAFDALIENNLEPELFSFHIFKSFNNYLDKQGLQQYPVHIKLDTGMHRLGFEEKDMPELSKLLKSNNNVVVKSVFSHLAASEDPEEDAFTQQQAEVFVQCCKELQNVLQYSFIRHISNSAAIFRHPQLQFDMVRLGIGLYGMESTAEQQLSLQTVCSLKTTIAQLRKVKAGETIGYNRKGKVTKDSLIATIRIGYADGFNRHLSNGAGEVFIRGHRAKVIGTVCMDMTMIDVTDIDGVNENDEVEIFGNNIPVREVAKRSNTIAYEILTSINQRVKRVYVEE